MLLYYQDDAMKGSIFLSIEVAILLATIISVAIEVSILAIKVYAGIPVYMSITDKIEKKEITCKPILCGDEIHYPLQQNNKCNYPDLDIIYCSLKRLARWQWD
jgi:hypothetical protein